MDQQRIAILPFQILGDASYYYLAESLMESAQIGLREVPNFLIISKESVLHFADGKKQDLSLVFDQLQIDMLIKGSLEVKYGKLQIVIEAIVDKGQQSLWKKTLYSELKEVISLGTRFINFLRQELQVEKEISLEGDGKFPRNRQAYRAYLLGEHYLQKWNRAYTELALTQFEKVTALEPDFIPAYLGMAKATIFLVGRGFKLAETSYPKVLQMLNQMLLINPSYGELYIYKGVIEFFYLLDWDSAYKNIEKGLKNYSEASEAYSQLSHFWYGMRNYDKAIEAIHIAMEYNPLSISLLNMKGDIQISAKRYQEAINTFNHILTLQADDMVALENLMYIYALIGNERMAKKYLRRMQSKAELSVVSFPRIGYVQAKFGQEKDWKSLIEQLENQIKDDGNRTHINRLATLYAGLKDWQKVMSYIEEGFKHRTGILFILTDPMFEPLHQWKRYKKLEAAILLPKRIINEDHISIQSDLKKRIEINPHHLLYAITDQNYTTLIQYNNFRLEKILLRISLQRLLEQLPKDLFFHCHRSYLINNQLDLEITGNARGYKLYAKAYDFTVPVARTKIKEMKELFF